LIFAVCVSAQTRYTMTGRCPRQGCRVHAARRSARHPRSHLG
jgi:hypothetical protein